MEFTLDEDRIQGRLSGMNGARLQESTLEDDSIRYVATRITITAQFRVSIDHVFYHRRISDASK
jgi:hypothetical protein